MRCFRAPHRFGVLAALVAGMLVAPSVASGPGSAVAVAAQATSASGLTVMAVPPVLAAPPVLPLPPHLAARSAAVIDADTWNVLWEANGHVPLPMASTAKIMTALVALQAWGSRLDTPMTVPPDVRQVYGERVYLDPGSRYTFGEMLQAMVIASANDAAVTIAVNVAGTQAAFVRRMNAEAAALGLRDTHFVNPDGLDVPHQDSSALDLARLGAVAMRNPVFKLIASTIEVAVPQAKLGEEVLRSHNYLLTTYPGANGVKIGYTSGALNCVVGSARRGTHDVIAVVMGEGPHNEWLDESALLNFGFAMLDAPASTSRSVAAIAPASVPRATRARPAAPARSVRSAASPPTHRSLLWWVVIALIAVWLVRRWSRRSRGGRARRPTRARNV